VIRTKETNEGNLCADSLLWQAQQLAVQEGLPLPVMSFQNGGGIRNNSILAAGNFTELNTFQILPFSNFVAIVPNVPMAKIKALLENAVSRVSPSPGYPSSGNGRFAQVGGFSFSYFVDTVPGQRVRDVILNDGTVLFDEGIAVNSEATVAIATIDFLCRGGDEYPLNGLPFENLGVSYQQALFNYVTQGLGGQITAADYPTAGEGRIVRIDSPADFDNNSIINGVDLVVLLGQWGGAGSADLNGSGVVDGDDFSMFLATWTEPSIP
jgi:5'-nucleotidase